MLRRSLGQPAPASRHAYSRAGSVANAAHRGFADPPYGIVTGIGFLGAGAILKHRDEADVQGLTTAAGIWMTAAIGVACGLGRETTALLSAVLAWGVLAVLPRLVGRDRG